MLVQSILIGLIAAFGAFDWQLGTLYAFRPIVLCPLVGLVLGDLQTGLAIGASLELLFMGSISIGAYVPPNETVGGVLACAFAISLGESTEAAIALAMPIAVLTLSLKNIMRVIDPFFVDMADKFAAQGNVKGIYAIHFLLGNALGCVLYFILCSTAFYLGVDAVKGLLDMIPQFAIDGFGIAANILPAMGFAMLAQMTVNKKVVVFFAIGFVLSSYMGVPVLGIAILGVAAAILQTGLLNGDAPAVQAAIDGGDDDDF